MLERVSIFKSILKYFSDYALHCLKFQENLLLSLNSTAERRFPEWQAFSLTGSYRLFQSHFLRGSMSASKHFMRRASPTRSAKKAGLLRKPHTCCRISVAPCTKTTFVR